MENSTLPRKEREKIKRKDEILHAALKLFSEKGFHNVSMQDIAVKSEFAVGTLYNFFTSKDLLFDELRNNCAEKIYQAIYPILESKKREDEILRDIVRAYAKLAEDNIEFIKLYVSQFGTIHLVLPKEGPAENVKKTLDAKLEDLIKSGIKNGIFHQVDEKIVSLAFVSTIRAFVLESSMNFDKSALETGLNKIEHLFLGMLLKKEAPGNE